MRLVPAAAKLVPNTLAMALLDRARMAGVESGAPATPPELTVGSEDAADAVSVNVTGVRLAAEARTVTAPVALAPTATTVAAMPSVPVKVVDLDSVAVPDTTENVTGSL